MFIKVTDNNWINLNTCRKIEVWERSKNNWAILFRPTTIGPDNELSDSIEPFGTELEAQEVLDTIWSAYRNEEKVWEPEPRNILNVKMCDKWMTNDQAIDTFLDVIEKFGLDEVANLGLIVNNILLISNVDDSNRAQRKIGDYYIVSGTNTLRKKFLIEEIADKLGVEVEVTANPKQ